MLVTSWCELRNTSRAGLCRWQTLLSSSFSTVRAGRLMFLLCLHACMNVCMHLCVHGGYRCYGNISRKKSKSLHQHWFIVWLLQTAVPWLFTWDFTLTLFFMASPLLNPMGFSVNYHLSDVRRPPLLHLKVKNCRMHHALCNKKWIMQYYSHNKIAPQKMNFIFNYWSVSMLKDYTVFSTYESAKLIKTYWN